MPKSCEECLFHYCSEYHPFWSGCKEKRNTKTIRCQAITPFRSTVLDIKDETFKPDWCPLVDTADVVPRERYNRAMDGLKAVLEERAEDKVEVVREIFEEIAQIKKEYASGDIDGDTLYVRLHLPEQKYTEDTP